MLCVTGQCLIVDSGQVSVDEQLDGQRSMVSLDGRSVRMASGQFEESV